jgi:hypothetical protein
VPPCLRAFVPHFISSPLPHDLTRGDRLPIIPPAQTPPSSSGLGQPVLSRRTGVRLPLGVFAGLKIVAFCGPLGRNSTFSLTDDQAVSSPSRRQRQGENIPPVLAPPFASQLPLLAALPWHPLHRKGCPRFAYACRGHRVHCGSTHHNAVLAGPCRLLSGELAVLPARILRRLSFAASWPLSFDLTT